MININQIIRKNLLKEEKFHDLKKEIKFSFEIYHDAGGHTQQRKWRHGSENKIYDSISVEEIEKYKKHSHRIL